MEKQEIQERAEAFKRSLDYGRTTHANLLDSLAGWAESDLCGMEAATEILTLTQGFVWVLTIGKTTLCVFRDMQAGLDSVQSLQTGLTMKRTTFTEYAVALPQGVLRLTCVAFHSEKIALPF